MLSVHSNLKEIELGQLNQPQIIAKVQEQSEVILANAQHRQLLQRFFDEHVKMHFEDISFVDLVERQMVVSTYDNGKRIRIIPYERNGNPNYALHYPTKIYEPLMEVCIEEGILQHVNNKYYNHLLLTVCFKRLAQTYFASRFTALYGQFFVDVEHTEIEQVIATYYNIPSIEHDSILNFSQFTYYLMEHHQEVKKLSEKSLNMVIGFLNDVMDDYLGN